MSKDKQLTFTYYAKGKHCTNPMVW